MFRHLKTRLRPRIYYTEGYIPIAYIIMYQSEHRVLSFVHRGCESYMPSVYAHVLYMKLRTQPSHQIHTVYRDVYNNDGVMSMT